MNVKNDLHTFVQLKQSILNWKPQHWTYTYFNNFVSDQSGFQYGHHDSKLICNQQKSNMFTVNNFLFVSY